MHSPTPTVQVLGFGCVFVTTLIPYYIKLTHWGRDKMAATLADDTFKYKFVNENV